MPARAPASPSASAFDDLPDPLPAVVLLVGAEELLVSRATHALSVAARRQEPEVTESELSGAALEGAELHELLGPSLFGDARLVVVREAQDLSAGALSVLSPYLQTPTPAVTITLQHLGAAKGKVVLETARAAGAYEIGCAPLTRASERLDFVRAEVRRAGGRITPEAAAALVDAVGTDLRELAAVSGQLVSDCGGAVDVDVVHAYHRGRADVTGFAVADQVMAGNAVASIQALREALVAGVPPVLIADALADGVRTLARVATAGRADAFTLARNLGMPKWKVDKAQRQMRGWDEVGVRRAFAEVAVINADVKGVAADPGYALERGIRALLAARRGPAH